MKEEFKEKNGGNEKKNISTNLRKDDGNDATILAKAIEIWRLCYIFVW